MKANEAPEKIYLEAVYPDNGVLPNGLNYTSSPTDIEYTRTDAFIKKASFWLECNLSDRPVEDRKFWVEDFVNYIKGE